MEAELSEYSLFWNGHIQHIKKAFQKLQQSNELCDVTLYVEGHRIGAHKVLLSACSKYFDQLFKDFKNERPVIVLKGVKLHILKHILRFVYNGQTNVEIDELNQFLETAAFLKIEGLTENHIKRKRKSSFDEEDCSHKSDEQTDALKGTTQFSDKGKPLDRNKFDHYGLSKILNAPSKLPKLRKIGGSRDSPGTSDGNGPDFSKAPEICKYPMDPQTKESEWFSDYEFVSDNTVESQCLSVENTDDPALDENPCDLADDDAELQKNTKDIKTESSDLANSDIEDMTSFDQDDFANSLDAEIDTSDDGEYALEKQLLKTPLASVDEKGLYLCKICGKTYVKKDSLKKHFAVHVNNTTCMICGRVLSRKTHLIRHLKVHGIQPK